MYLDKCLELVYKNNDQLKRRLERRTEHLNVFKGLHQEMWMKLHFEDIHSEQEEV